MCGAAGVGLRERAKNYSGTHFNLPLSTVHFRDYVVVIFPSIEYFISVMNPLNKNKNKNMDEGEKERNNSIIFLCVQI